MCAEALTQAEIDALLRGETPAASSESAPAPSEITPDEEDIIQTFGEMVSQSGSDVYSTLLGENAVVEMASFKEVGSNEIKKELDEELVTAELNYKGLVQGKSVVLLSIDNALKLANQMTGGGSESEFSDLEESAFSEAIQQLYSAVNTKLSHKAGGEVQIDTPDVITKPEDLAEVMPESNERQILVEYSIQSESLSGSLYQVIPRNLLRSISDAASGKGGVDAMLETTTQPRGASTAPEVLSAPAQFLPGGYGAGAGMESLGAIQGLDVDTRNLELILDISLEIKVELGRTNRKIREVLEMGPGSVIELDKLAGESVDILVNDKLFAKGEVVVIDENFGVRITDILTIQERIEALK